MIYLAGPINGCTDDEAVNWRDFVKDSVGADMCIDPMRRDYRGVEDQNVTAIVHGDITDIDDCSVVLANCWQASVGTSMELWYAAREARKPVVVMVPPGSRVSPWLQYVASHIVTDLSEGIKLARGLS